MQLIRGLANLRKFSGGCVATIGNFDGVHLGHRAVIQKLSEKGREMGLPVVIILFEPQPQEFFLSEDVPARLCRLREKLAHFKCLPVDYAVCIRFNREFSKLQPDDFVQNILIDGLGLKYLVVGDDFRFGFRRKGDFQLLEKMSVAAGFTVEDTGSLYVKGDRVSSTLIRETLKAGDLNKAAELLGRAFSVLGRIVYGDQKGRTIGFPTANLRMQRKSSPIEGVFAVTMTGLACGERFGVANVGSRPTVQRGQTILLETHLFDFDENIYGQHVEVHFHEKIRSERRFDSLDELKKQIAKDVSQARQILNVKQKMNLAAFRNKA